MKFSHHSSSRSLTKIIITSALVIFVLLIVISAYVVRQTYQSNLSPVSQTSKTHVVTIEPGSTTAEIADNLKTKGVIKSDWAFEWYVRNAGLRDKIKAGTYVVDENQSVQDIVNIIVDGKVATDLITILPGKTLQQIKDEFEKDGYTKAEIEKALNPANYANHPALTDLPRGATLEGYLYPESFQKTADTQLEDIVKLSLDEMNTRLSPDVRQGISKQGLSLHEGIILASIIEKESSQPEDRTKVAQVFEKRLKLGKRLESNATDAYAEINPKYDSYNIDGLPPGPIGNFTESSLDAVAFPSQTDWLYFVTGDDKKTYFSKTFEEHQELIDKYCTTGCAH